MDIAATNNHTASSESLLIYRVTGTTTAKSLSLHKNSDYQTGLSFFDYDPGGHTIKFRISRLVESGYQVRHDGNQPMVNIWTNEPYIEPNSGQNLYFPPGHVSIWYNDREYWFQWHLADKANLGAPDISPQLQAFFDLREK